MKTKNKPTKCTN